MIEDRMTALPENQIQLLHTIETLPKEQEMRRVARNAIEQNMNPSEKVLAGISDRYALSSLYGVDEGDFEAVLREIQSNEKVLVQLNRLNAMGTEITIVSVNEAEVILIDSVDNVNVKAQEKFLLELPQGERTDAISSLTQRFPDIGQYLEQANSASGLNYYESLLLCEVMGTEPITKDEWVELQHHKPVDRRTMCWLLSRQIAVNNNIALYGGRRGLGIFVNEGSANYCIDIRAYRPRLRVERT